MHATFYKHCSLTLNKQSIVNCTDHYFVWFSKIFSVSFFKATSIIPNSKRPNEQQGSRKDDCVLKINTWLLGVSSLSPEPHISVYHSAISEWQILKRAPDFLNGMNIYHFTNHGWKYYSGWHYWILLSEVIPAPVHPPGSRCDHEPLTKMGLAQVSRPRCTSGFGGDKKWIHNSNHIWLFKIVIIAEQNRLFFWALKLLLLHKSLK